MIGHDEGSCDGLSFDRPEEFFGFSRLRYELRPISAYQPVVATAGSTTIKKSFSRGSTTRDNPEDWNFAYLG